MPQRLDVAKTYKLFINGAFPRTESGRSIPIQDAKGNLLAHVCQGSRKDLRDAVEVAAAAQPKWANATPYNRGQVLYRMAEMLQGKRDEFAELLKETSKRQSVKKSKAKSPSVLQEVDAAIDRLVCFAGWADKYAQVLGCNNPVSGPYYNFTVPEATGVVGIVVPSGPPTLLEMTSLIAPPLCAGNAVVVIASDDAMIPAAVFGEICATSDVPAGVINIITGIRSELLEHLAKHRGVNAVSAANLSREETMLLKLGTSDNVKRVHVAKIADADWFDAAVMENPWTIEPFVEFKTIWHPAAV
jgi:acyl-CoA reductase-like NAD-dependent aldehyde dehydrogenase